MVAFQGRGETERRRLVERLNALDVAVCQVALDELSSLPGSERLALLTAELEVRDAQPGEYDQQSDWLMRLALPTSLAAGLTAQYATGELAAACLTGVMLLGMITVFAAMLRSSGRRNLQAGTAQARQHIQNAVARIADVELAWKALWWLQRQWPTTAVQAEVMERNAAAFTAYYTVLANGIPLFSAERKQAMLQQHELLTALIERPATPAALRLRILEVVAESGSEPYVYSVRAVARRSERRDNPDVVRAANPCLERLLARVEQQKNAATLLRASNAHTSAPETLLRPRDGSNAVSPEQLLRPANLPSE